MEQARWAAREGFSQCPCEELVLSGGLDSRLGGMALSLFLDQGC